MSMRERGEYPFYWAEFVFQEILARSHNLFGVALTPMCLRTGKLVYQAYAGPHLLGRLGDSAAEAAELLVELPSRFDRVLGEIERGNLRIWTRVEDVEPIIKRLERMVARTSATILAAACIVPSSCSFIIPKDGKGGSGWCSG